MEDRPVPADRIITIRVPRVVSDEVRRLAAREAETQSVILRRLLRVGLDVERRDARHHLTGADR